MRRTALRTMRAVLVPVGLALLCVAVRAQPQVPRTEADPPKIVDEQDRRQNTFTAGVLLLIGVTAIGLLLIAAAIVWGAKVRRMARRPEPRSSQRDDLWYLRGRIPSADPDETVDEAASLLEDPDRP